MDSEEENEAPLASETPPPQSTSGSAVHKERRTRQILHQAVAKAFLVPAGKQDWVPLGGGDGASDEGHPCCLFEFLKSVFPGMGTITEFINDVNKEAKEAGCVFAPKLTL